MSEVRSKAYWVLTTPPYTHQGVTERSVSVALSIPGVVVFLPPDIQASPVYVMVTHLQGRRLNVRVVYHFLCQIAHPADSPDYS